MSHHPDPVKPNDTEIINERVSAIAYGIALGALVYDYPVNHIDTGDAPFSYYNAHEILRAAQRDEDILEELTQDYIPLAKEFADLIPAAAVLDPSGYVQVSPEIDGWDGVGMELYIYHNLPLDPADLTITPKRREGIFSSHIEGDDDLVLVLDTPQRTHRILCAKDLM